MLGFVVGFDIGVLILWNIWMLFWEIGTKQHLTI